MAGKKPEPKSPAPFRRRKRGVGKPKGFCATWFNGQPVFQRVLAEAVVYIGSRSFA